MKNNWREVVLASVTLCLDCGEVFYSGTPRGAVNTLDHALSGDCVKNHEDWMHNLRKSIKAQVRSEIESRAESEIPAG
jgi:hypothetical protein